MAPVLAKTPEVVEAVTVSWAGSSLAGSPEPALAPAAGVDAPPSDDCGKGVTLGGGAAAFTCPTRGELPPLD